MGKVTDCPNIKRRHQWGKIVFRNVSIQKSLSFFKDKLFLMIIKKYISVKECFSAKSTVHSTNSLVRLMKSLIRGIKSAFLQPLNGILRFFERIFGERLLYTQFGNDISEIR